METRHISDGAPASAHANFIGKKNIFACWKTVFKVPRIVFLAFIEENNTGFILEKEYPSQGIFRVCCRSSKSCMEQPKMKG
jgi:hypothetical protein